ncbi:MAG TPA: hypothetical protein PKC67_15805 [Kiritimatiellia bacterium]|nr:hypothetical protein [Kiritimatiellia bacterium]HMP35800.1 hypothetical protein [Kiritimatiellia bacterium]
MQDDDRGCSLVAALRHWGFHALWCASPSFLLAYRVGGFRSGEAVAGMLAGIATVVLVLAVVTSSRVFQRRDGDGLLRRSVRIGSRIRSGVSAVGLIGMVAPVPLVFLVLPDMIAGVIALAVVEGAGQLLLGSRVSVTDNPGFVTAYAATVIEGGLIAGTLVVIVAIALVILRAVHPSAARRSSAVRRVTSAS